MISEINTERFPIKLWVSDSDTETLRQAKNLANLPFIHKHVALMPDAHVGFGMPIGGVAATIDVIIPNAVGVDIGCGMCAQKTNLTHIDTARLKTIVQRINSTIPQGHTWHKKPQDKNLMPKDIPQHTIVQQEFNDALHQLGTLGSGNHFIEIQKGNDGHIWIMVHSGSRNLGKKVADYYNRLAIKKNQKFLNQNNRYLAHLYTDSKEGREYIDEMNFCVAFALANRKLMMERILGIMEKEFPNFEPLQFINIAHNFAALETHFGKHVWVHRKGATRARKDELGIIPGSQGAPSYIVRGLGNPESFESCSHGAGRKLGRNEAIRTLDLKTEVEYLEKLGIIHSIRSQRDLEEAAGSYKDISEVMKNQSDLVEPIIELHPLAVVKG